jgi:aryl-alcohol dehydrogenase-like predicted oxidoreductase
MNDSARVDPKVPIEEVMNTLKGFVDEGKFQYIGLSECSAATVQRANKVSYNRIIDEASWLRRTRSPPLLPLK